MARKIVGYVRVNLPERVESAQEIEQQAERLKEQGATEIFVDIGSSLAKDRSEFSLMMALVCAGEVQEVVVTRLDRLTRSPTELGQFIDTFHANGASLRILDQQTNITKSSLAESRNKLLSLLQKPISQNFEQN